MTAYRAVTVGLLGAAVWLLARGPHAAAPPPSALDCPAIVAAPPADPLRVIDVARGTHELVNLVRLAANERITAVDDAPMTDDVFATSDAIEHAAQAHDYVDITVSGGSDGSRRMLILIH